MNDDDYSRLESEQAAIERRKLFWAPTIANTAGLVAFSSAVGSSAHPDFLFSNLQISISLFAGGIVASGVALLLDYFYTSRSLHYVNAITALGDATKGIEQAHRELSTFSPNFDAIAKVLGEEAAVHKIKGFWAWYEKKYEISRKLLDKREEELKAERKKQKSLGLHWNVLWIFVALAHLAFAGGVAYIVIAHANGTMKFDVSAEGTATSENANSEKSSPSNLSRHP